MKFAVFFVSILCSLTLGLGQQVTNESYDNMLKSLLSHTVPEISVSNAAMLKDAVFIDAREWNEYTVSHIRNAYWSGSDDFDLTRLNGVSKDLKLIVYCSVGYRSEKVAEKLLAAGYTHTWNLYGGIFEWKNQGHPVCDSAGKETENVHVYSKSWGTWLTSGTKVYN